MKIMLDTNIIISAALFPNGRAAQAFFKALQSPYQPLVCDYVVDELHRKFGINSLTGSPSWRHFYTMHCPSSGSSPPLWRLSALNKASVTQRIDQFFVQPWLHMLTYFSLVTRIFLNPLSRILELSPFLIFCPCEYICVNYSIIQ